MRKPRQTVPLSGSLTWLPSDMPGMDAEVSVTSEGEDLPGDSLLPGATSAEQHRFSGPSSNDDRPGKTLGFPPFSRVRRGDFPQKVAKEKTTAVAAGIVDALIGQPSCSSTELRACCCNPVNGGHTTSPISARANFS